MTRPLPRGGTDLTPRRSAVCSTVSLLLVFRQGADVVDDVPALFFSHALLARGHDARDALRDLPVDFAVSHCRHAFLIRQVGGFATQPRHVRFVAGAGLAMTEHAVTFRAFHEELFAFGNRLR